MRDMQAEVRASGSFVFRILTFVGERSVMKLDQGESSSWNFMAILIFPAVEIVAV